MGSIRSNIKSTLSIFRDKESVYSLVAQLLVLVVPFLTMGLLLSEGSDALVEYEIVMSLVSFFTIVGDFGVSQFLISSKVFCKDIKKTYSNVVYFKIINAVLVAPIVLFLLVIFDQNFSVWLLTLVLLILYAFESSFVYLAKGNAYVYVIICLSRNVFFLAIYFFTNNLYLSLIASTLLGAVGFIWTSSRFIFYKFSCRYIRYFYLKYRSFFAAEVVTSIFSQLDSYFVGVVLHANDAVLYMICRRLVRASLSLVAVLYKILYVRSFSGGSQGLPLLFFLFLYASLSGVFLYEYGFETAQLLGGTTLEFVSFQLVNTIFVGVLLAGVLKSIVSNLWVFPKNLFRVHLGGTVVGGLVFLFPLVVVTLLDVGVMNVVYFSLLRLATDLVYVFTVFLFLWFRSCR